MGTYINTGNAGFQRARNGEYVDKSPLISVINETLFTEKQFSCVSRCRRFGKSMAAKMLCAYYDQSCDSRSLFVDLKIAGDETFEQHLNKYPVIFLDLSDFVTRFKDEGIIPQMNKELIADEEAVAKGVDAAHGENTSILSYNNENSLACVLSLAFYYAKNDYTFHRELPTGKGFADLVLMPRKNSDKPAILLELKKDQSAGTAIDQIQNKEYHGKVSHYDGRVILVGINYDSKSKKHECKITFQT